MNADGELFVRHSHNPILRARDWPYPCHSVFNPGAARMSDGSTVLLCRVETRTGHSHLCVARSTNGLDGWVIDAHPSFAPEPTGFPEELYGIEDPRITYLEDLHVYAITYTAVTRDGPGVSLALTADFRSFERCGLVLRPHDKNAALLPRKIGGEYAMIHRPSHDLSGDVWISFSSDLRSWGNARTVLRARRGTCWDKRIGLACPPIDTERGWLLLYHGARVTAAGAIYRVGVALVEHERPDVCLRRGAEWVFGPEAPFEIVGDVPQVVFPCGATLLADGDTLRVYYGAADTCIGVAHTQVSRLLHWLDTSVGDP